LGGDACQWADEFAIRGYAPIGFSNDQEALIEFEKQTQYRIKKRHYHCVELKNFEGEFND
jgi:hypothetical protein